jgi:hypothetical protein
MPHRVDPVKFAQYRDITIVRRLEEMALMLSLLNILP